MNGQLFGSMALFYALSSGAGGGVTPPSSFIGAAPQIKFGTAANQGFLSSDGATTGVTLSHAIDVVAGVDTATQVYGGRIRMNSSTDFLVIDSSSSGMVPGTPASPTSRLLWAFGSYAQFSDLIIAPSFFATGAVVPSSGEGLAIISSGGLTQMISKTWPSGNLDQINIAGNTVNLQVGATTGITSTWTFDSFGQVTHLHNAQAGAAESLYVMSVSDDATAKIQFKNFVTTNGAFVANFVTIGSSNRNALVNTVTITTDSSTAACRHTNFDVGGSNVTVRPLETWASVGATLLQLIPLSTGNNAAFNWGTTANGSPAITTRSAGTRLILASSISGTQFDWAAGVESGYLWFTSGAAAASATTSGIKFYASGSTTPVQIFYANGQTDLTGLLRITGGAAPTSGAALHAYYSGGTGTITCVDPGVTYRPLELRGNTVSLMSATAVMFSVDSSKAIAAVPVQFASYTLATLPTASSFTRAQIWVSDMTGGAQYAYSDGTNWRRVSDGTIAS